mmetsp:Transcript_276/g.315  ORF Transcript_276/g.315 Transcript_276/m.315 type:complete len:367 (-) Transcript_276:48-1148(-)
MEASANESQLADSPCINVCTPKGLSESDLSANSSESARNSEQRSQISFQNLVKETLFDQRTPRKLNEFDYDLIKLGAPPNSYNSENQSLSKRGTDTHGESRGTSGLVTNRTAVQVKFHSRSNSYKDMKHIQKTPQGRTSTACSSKASPIKHITRLPNRSLSLDLTGLVDDIDYTQKRSEIVRLKLITRLLKSDLSRLHWDDFREVKYTVETERRENENYELQFKHYTEMEFRRQQEKRQRRQSQLRKNWSTIRAKDNRETKKKFKCMETMKQHDELVRSHHQYLLRKEARDRLDRVKQYEAEMKRSLFQEQMQIQAEARAKLKEQEKQDLMIEAQKRIDDMFEQALKENQETLAKLMTAKYSRRGK